MICLDSPSHNTKHSCSCNKKSWLKETLNLVGWDKPDDREIDEEEEYEADQCWSCNAGARRQGVFHVQEAREY